MQMEKGMEADFSRMIIKKHLASGAFGSVYKALYDGREVAVKVLDLGDENTKTTLLHAFMQEFIVWNKLDHPNIAKFIGAKGTSDLRVIPGHGKGRMPRNGCCIVAEYVGGGTLSSYLWKNRIRKLPLNVVIQLALDAARGLCYLHSRKVVHRDVKTDNMLLDNSRRVKIIDFGVSRFEALNPTEMTAQTGTAGYMAPEVLCSSPYDHKCDVFSFGICLWEIYCCARPNFTTSFRPVIPENCPSSLANLMNDCWDADPKRRPEMAEVVHCLEAMETSKEESTKLHDHPRGCFSFFKQ